MNTCTNPDGTGGIPKTLNFLPWLPYALDPTDGPNYPERTCGNRSYISAAKTPDDVFWGWGRFFDLMNSVLAQARTASISVSALDYFQETNMAFTVEGRMIYDNTHSVDVLGELRTRMSWNGFDPGRVAPSANNSPSPTPANGDCGSFYGDSALLINLSEQTAAIAGPSSVIGDPPYVVMYGSLECFSSSDSSQMISLPVYHSQPTFTDMHSQKTYASAYDTAAWALNYYSDIWSFLQYRGLTSNYVVFGETNPVDNPGCDEWTQAQADAVLNGIPGWNNGYKHSTLFANHAASVTFRPWHNGVYDSESCTPSPNRINPPFDPSTP